jgi:hypothetical protein
LFLFSLNVKDDWSYVSTRLKRIAFLYLFWTGLWVYVTQRNIDTLRSLMHPDAWVPFIVTAGGSEYYFFFSLFLLTLVAWLVRRVSTPILWFLTIVSMAAIGGMPALVAAHPAWWLLTAWQCPLNFVPCTLIAVLMARYWKSGVVKGDRNRARLIPLCLVLLACFIAAACIEWRWLPNENQFLGDNQVLPGYTRVSVAIGGALAVAVGLLITSPAPRIIRVLSDLSLGIYCLHAFVLRIGVLLTIPGGAMSRFAAVVTVTAAAAYFVRHALKHRMI